MGKFNSIFKIKLLYLTIFISILFLIINSSFASENLNYDECIINEKQNQITFANLTFGENINQTYCRLTKILDEEKYQISLFGYETNGYFPKEGMGNITIEHDIKNDNDSKIISDLVYHNFCSLKKEEIQYFGEGNYHSKILNLSDTKSVHQGGFNNTKLNDKIISTVSPYSLMIYPISIQGSDFVLQLIFDLDFGKLINDDLTINEKVFSHNICKEPYDSSGFEKVYFPYSLRQIMLHTHQDFDKNINTDVYEEILLNLKNKYKLVKDGKTSGYKFFTNIGCDSSKHTATDGLTMIKLCYNEFPNVLTINYALSNSFFINSDSKVSNFLNSYKNRKLEKNDRSDDL